MFLSESATHFAKQSTAPELGEALRGNRGISRSKTVKGSVRRPLRLDLRPLLRLQSLKPLQLLRQRTTRLLQHACGLNHVKHGPAREYALEACPATTSTKDSPLLTVLDASHVVRTATSARTAYVLAAGRIRNVMLQSLTIANAKMMR